MDDPSAAVAAGAAVAGYGHTHALRAGGGRELVVRQRPRRPPAPTPASRCAGPVSPVGDRPVVHLDPAPARAWGWELLCVGRLDRAQGRGHRGQALAQLPHAPLSLAGGGDAAYERKLRARVDELGLGDRVPLRRAVDGERRPRSTPPPTRPCSRSVGGAVGPGAPGGDGARTARRRHGARRAPAEYLRDGDNCVLFEAGDAGWRASALRGWPGIGGCGPPARARARHGRRHTAPRFHAAVGSALEELEGPQAAAAPLWRVR